ncbi:MAG: HAD-IIA family hydrolase [Candidatus Lokiarchaeota archaeon]|nr:HAD-IIA family hydrolase [Candidatus Lokiarchaeota archaeon]
MKDKSSFFFDLDGTIYLGNNLFKGVHELISLLKEKRKKFFFLSNNSSRSTSDYLSKLKKMNLEVSRENIILSQHPTIAYLKYNNYKKIFLLGNQSLKDEFIQEGFILDEIEPEILVLAFDQEFTYDRLAKATSFLLNDIPYIATHLDNRCPTEDGYIPDAGGTAALLCKASGRMPRVFGKPNKDMILFKLKELGMCSEDAVMFGDRLYTDMKMGKDAGITTCLVLSGESTMEMLGENEIKPDFVLEGVWKLLDIL